MCHFRDDTSEAVEWERELREEYTTFDDDPETVDPEEPELVADGGEE